MGDGPEDPCPIDGEPCQDSCRTACLRLEPDSPHTDLGGLTPRRFDRKAALNSVRAILEGGDQ